MSHQVRPHVLLLHVRELVLEHGVFESVLRRPQLVTLQDVVGGDVTQVEQLDSPVSPAGAELVRRRWSGVVSG